MEDPKLIEEAKAGNKSAQNKLLSDNYSILTGYVMKMTADSNLAQDIVQETLLKAVVNMGKFTPKAKFSTWLIKISINVYRDYLRKNRITEVMDETITDISPGPEEQVISKLQYREIAKTLHDIPYEKKAVFILKHYYGYKYDEIAEMLECPIGTVRSRLHYCIKYLMDEMERRRII